MQVWRLKCFENVESGRAQMLRRVCRALLRVYRALLRIYRALLRIYRVLLHMSRAVGLFGA